MAQKNGIEKRARKSGATLVSRIVSRFPRTITPDGRVRLPLSTASAPTTSVRNDEAGDCIFGESARSIERANPLAVTGAPVLKRKPGRIVNVYCLPPRATRGNPVATSGLSLAPALPLRSG